MSEKMRRLDTVAGAEVESVADGCADATQPRLLIVDDEEYIREALGHFLRLRGFCVDLANDGLEAVEKCSKHTYNLVTMDLEMPKLGGREAILRIHDIYPALPIVVLTGYAHLLDEHPLPGVSGVLTKPISLWKVEEEIRKFI